MLVLGFWILNFRFGATSFLIMWMITNTHIIIAVTRSLYILLQHTFNWCLQRILNPINVILLLLKSIVPYLLQPYPDILYRAFDVKVITFSLFLSVTFAGILLLAEFHKTLFLFRSCEKLQDLIFDEGLFFLFCEVFCLKLFTILEIYVGF